MRDKEGQVTLSVVLPVPSRRPVSISEGDPWKMNISCGAEAPAGVCVECKPDPCWEESGLSGSILSPSLGPGNQGTLGMWGCVPFLLLALGRSPRSLNNLTHHSAAPFLLSLDSLVVTQSENSWDTRSFNITFNCL